MSQVKVTADSGGGTVSLKAPATTTSNAAVVLTLPVDDGAANTFLKSNGSGVTSWAAPTATEIGTTSGTASADTFLCGNNTWAEAGGGKILQVVSTEKTDIFTGYGTTWFDITGMSLAITPSATSSKILVQVHMPVSCSAALHGATRLVRGSTPISIGDTGPGTSTECSAGGYYTISDVWNVGIVYLDSPSTTSATTYKLQGYTYSGTLAVNRNGYTDNYGYNFRWSSSLTLTEVSA